MGRTRVRIVGDDPKIAGRILEVIRRNFICSRIRHYNRMPYRYGMRRGVTIYVTVEKEQEESK